MGVIHNKDAPCTPISWRLKEAKLPELSHFPHQPPICYATPGEGAARGERQEAGGASKQTKKLDKRMVRLRQLVVQKADERAIWMTWVTMSQWIAAVCHPGLSIRARMAIFHTLYA
eukprot:351184-Chlamydomonas_euryale.AAC.3